MATANDQCKSPAKVMLPGLRGVLGEVSSPAAVPRSPAHDLAVSPFQEQEEQDERTDQRIEQAYADAEKRRLQQSTTTTSKPSVLADVLNCSRVLADGASAIVDDGFLRCFTGQPYEPWNWNTYLYPAWLAGVFIRHCILFPIRLLLLLLANILFFITFFGVGAMMKPSPRRKAIELWLVQSFCGAWLMSWSAVVRYHGPKPIPAVNRVWVSNHSSMIDYTILCSHSPFAVIMQLQTGWVAFLQTRVLNTLGCLWFNRTDLKDRHVVGERMRSHVTSPGTIPLLIFPEGVCVNNEYCVLFKRGAFDMGATVCPIAIKYNKTFVDGYWNSKRQSFSRYILRLMTSWALVCDVWFLEPQTKRPDESVDQFAARVQKMIADTAGLKITQWDGMLKYYNLGQTKPGLVEQRRKAFADMVRQHHLTGEEVEDALAANGSAHSSAAAPAADAGTKKDR